MDIGVALLIGIGAAFTLPRAIAFVKDFNMRGKKAPPLRDGEIFADGRQIIYFYTEQCPGCRVQAPIVNRLITNFPGKVTKINVSEHTDATQKYHIFGVPSTIFIEDGKFVKSMTGPVPEAKLTAFLIATRDLK